MKIKVINPNTTASMTAKIGVIARSVANPEAQLIFLSFCNFNGV